MFNISTYLEKFKQLGVGDMLVKQSVTEVLKEKLGIEIKTGDISIKQGVATIKINPLIKNHIYIKKAEIMEAILKKTDKVKDIK